MAINRIPYRISLRVLGKLLNGEKARMVTVCEIDQGFLLHYFVKGEPGQARSRAIHGAEVLDLDDVFRGQRGKPEPAGSFAGLPSMLGFRQGEALRFQKSHPLCPMGYEQFLRAIGEACDRRNAQAMMITELEEYVHVEYTVERSDFVVRNGQRMALPGRRDERYSAERIVELVRQSREQALENVRRSGQNLSFNPMDVASYLNAALAIEDDGEYRNAEELFRMAAQLAPRHAETRYHLARHARRRGDRKAALKHLEQAISLRGDDGRFYHLLGRINMERHHFEAAMYALERAIACDTDNAVYHFDLSRVYERLGRTEDARAVLARRGAVISVHGASSVVAELWAAGAATPDPLAATATTVAAPRDHDEIAATEAHGTTEAGVAGSPSRTLAARLETAESPYATAPLAPLPAGPAGHPAQWDTPVPLPLSTGADFPLAEAGGQPGWDSAQSAAPFGAEAPAWQASAATPGEPFAALAEAAERPAQSAAEGLPVLGLSIANNWATPTLPALDVPADGAAAGAALPLAVSDVWDTAPVDTVSALIAATALTETAEPMPPGEAEDAVQLAAAIMRVQDMLQGEPERADLHRKLGFLLAKQGRSDEAAAEFRRAVECGRRRLAE